MEVTKTTHTPNIKLIKNSKGYAWEIKMDGDDLKKVLKEIEEIDNLMKEKFKRGEVKKE